MGLLNFLAPPANKPLLPADKIAGEYKAMRIKVFLGIFLGYAAFYLVRKNLSLAATGMIEDGILDKFGAGIAMSGISIAYALSKFLMGSISDRSDARKFMSIGLALAAGIMLVAGLLPYGVAFEFDDVTNTSTLVNEYKNIFNVGILFIIMLLAGWLSGMGWPPCGRILAQWFSPNERSFKMSVWNTAHNVGNGSLGLLVIAGVAIFGVLGLGEDWRASFIFPSLVAMLFALFCWWMLRDRPEACGLPAIEDYRKDYTGAKASKGEEEKIPFKRLFVDYMFKNKLLLMIGFANIFVYFIRYGISDWSPTYLSEVCNLDKDACSLAYAIREYAGIPGTILCGWISTKFFNGRCAPVNVIFMSVVALGVLMYWCAVPIAEFTHIPLEYVVYTALAIIGGFVYGPVAMIGIQALSLVPKNAAGTAAGFMSLFGYLAGDALLSKWVMGYVAGSSLGWDFTFWMFLFACVFAVVICSVVWPKEKHIMDERVRQAELERANK